MPLTSAKRNWNSHWNTDILCGRLLMTSHSATLRIDKFVLSSLTTTLRVYDCGLFICSSGFISFSSSFVDCFFWFLSVDYKRMLNFALLRRIVSYLLVQWLAQTSTFLHWIARYSQHYEQDSFTFRTETPSWHTFCSRRSAEMQRLIRFVICYIHSSKYWSSCRHS